MRAVGEVLLIVLQWALVITGALSILTALNVWWIDMSLQAAREATAAGGEGAGDLAGSFYRVPVMQRLLTGLCSGLIAMGLGAILFYLRRLRARREG
ncbi:hypothetical protein ACQ5SO_04720 [Rhodovulum sp. DZ06]|uniref:hypothetical protein n=1 Tax=Rhodovulum sp. DZ06 TaxID=3425126 RepID=UPI003D34C728